MDKSNGRGSKGREFCEKDGRSPTRPACEPERDRPHTLARWGDRLLLWLCPSASPPALRSSPAQAQQPQGSNRMGWFTMQCTLHAAPLASDITTTFATFARRLLKTSLHRQSIRLAHPDAVYLPPPDSVPCADPASAASS